MSESSQSPHGDLARPPAVSRRRLCAIDAFIDLVLEGNLPPTPKQVAERAGISMATFFRYFENLNDIRLSAAARMVERFPLLEVEQMRYVALIRRRSVNFNEVKGHVRLRLRPPHQAGYLRNSQPYGVRHDMRGAMRHCPLSHPSGA